jgi:hypothetical protein
MQQFCQKMHSRVNGFGLQRSHYLRGGSYYERMRAVDGTTARCQGRNWVAYQ